MQKKTLFFAGIVICLLVFSIIGVYWYQKPRAGVSDIKPDYTIGAKELYSAFEQDENKANEQYVGKVIEVKGAVDNVQLTDTTVNLLLTGNVAGGINCSIKKEKNDQKAMPLKGDVVTVKGRCVGFLMDVNLVDAVIQNKK
jgi:hypothetical protein